MTAADSPRDDGGDRDARKPRYSSADSRPRGGERASQGGARSAAPRRAADKKPYVKRDGDKKPYAARDGERKSYPPRDGDRKGYVKRDGDRPYASRDGERKAYAPRDGDRKPYVKRDGDKKPYAARGGERKSYPPRDGDRKPCGDRQGDRKPYGTRDGDRKPFGNRGTGDRRSRPPQDSDRRTVPRGPEVPEEVTPQDLPTQARNELKTLSKENADQVARHLAMAASLIDEDPALAHEHALAASRSAGRIAIVRETVAITAYAVGDYALALRELRTFRRISGRDDQIALMVDSERGVGRPDRALEVGRAVDRTALPVDVRVELAIAMSGARLDQGEPDRALQELEIPELDPDRAFSWSPGLFAARAVVLEELGRDEEAAEWHRRANVAADALGALDADREVMVVDEIEELILDDAPEPAADAESVSASDPGGDTAAAPQGE